MAFLSCCGKKFESDPPTQRSLEIEHMLLEDNKYHRNTHKLLLFGAGESGKSTILKQMQVINMEGFSFEERQGYIILIRNNVREAITSILGAMKTINPAICIDNDQHAEIATRLLDEHSVCEYTDNFFDDCELLWKTKEVQDCFERSNEYQLIDCAKYFLDKISVLRHNSYLPDDQDILHCRVMTDQISEIHFKIKEARFHMFDIGGQRDQRYKWIQCFSNCTAIVFVASISEYNLVLREDKRTNRFQESLNLFKKIWENRFLRYVSIILFLNKEDILLEKILAGKFKIEDTFPAYKSYKSRPASKKEILKGPVEFIKAKCFFRDCFLSIIHESKPPSTSKRCYPHFTCAVDTNHMKRIFDDCRTIIQRIHLDRFGILAMG